jgi:outer membrane lipoprotein
MKVFKLTICLLALMTYGCAGTAPVTDAAAVAGPAPAIVQAPPGDLPLAAVRDDVQSYRGQQVRWGGTLLEVENEGSGSLLTIRARPLSPAGQPVAGSSDGVFVVRTSRPIDRNIYIPGRAVTVAGTLQENKLSTTDGLYYLTPLVDASEVYAWELIDRNYDYGYYDPYYRPYGGYPYGYYYPYPRFNIGLGFSNYGGDWHVGPFGGISIGF